MSDICFISPTLHRYLKDPNGKTTGGAERQQYMLATELTKRGYDVSAIVGSSSQSDRKTIEGIDIREGCPEGINSITTIPLQAAKLFDTMRRMDADAYYVRGAPRLTSVVSVFTRLLNTPLIFCIANESDIEPDYLLDRYSRPFYIHYKRVIATADQIVTQTNTQQTMLRDYFGADSVVIPNSYDLPPESEIREHKKREFVLWVGRSNKEKKKPMRYLELARKLPDIEFVMIAQPSNDGSHHREVQEESEPIDNLEFINTVPPDEIHEYYNRATILVNTSDYEGFPNTYLEAWRYQTPVISLYHSLDDVLLTENVGLRSGSMEELIVDVEKLHHDIRTRQEMGNHAREYVANNYLLKDVVDKYEELLSKL